MGCSMIRCNASPLPPLCGTDVVFTDAAREVYQGNSPYDRATYRYTPVLSWLLLPNVWARVWGKLVFCAADLVIGVLLYRILRLRGVSARGAAAYAAAFLCHPFTINVSSRGNADSLVCVAVLLTLYLLLRGRDLAAAAAFATAVHVKIYPIVYALPIILFLDASYAPGDFAEAPGGRGLAARAEAAGSRFGPVGSAVGGATAWLIRFLTWRRVRFGLVSGGLFLGATAALYALYGYTFLYETYLYHLVRTDNRHSEAAAAAAAGAPGLFRRSVTFPSPPLLLLRRLQPLLLRPLPALRRWGGRRRGRSRPGDQQQQRGHPLRRCRRRRRSRWRRGGCADALWHPRLPATARVADGPRRHVLPRPPVRAPRAGAGGGR